MSDRPDLSKRPEQIAGMFDQVARRYDLTNDVLSLGQDRLWRIATTAALEIRPGMKILDVAAGTGTSAAAYQRAGADVTAADFSPGMVAQGKKRYPHIRFVEADALALPFADCSFDAVTISYGLRNIVDPDAALREMLRVARPGGRLVVAEFSRPVAPVLRHIYNGFMSGVMPRLAGLVNANAPAYEYLLESIRAWPAQHQLAAQIRAAGWSSVQWRNLSAGIVALHRASKAI